MGSVGTSLSSTSLIDSPAIDEELDPRASASREFDWPGVVFGFMYGVGLPLKGCCCWLRLLNPGGVADPV